MALARGVAAERRDNARVTPAAHGQGGIVPNEILLYRRELLEHLVYEDDLAVIIGVHHHTNGAVPTRGEQSLIPGMPRALLERHQPQGTCPCLVETAFLQAQRPQRHIFQLAATLQLL